MSLAEKYDTAKTWEEVCYFCGKPVEMCAATWEVRGPYHEGCAGFPFCSCEVKHEGDCPVREPKAEG
jgi:hypothetical protein